MEKDRYKPSNLHKMDINPKKGLSQNFLIDQNILDKFLKAADVQKEDQIIEIGPGLGALTEHLLKAGAFVTAIEKDPKMCECLNDLQSDHFTLIQGDGLTFPIEKLPSAKLIGNLPFQITSPLIGRWIQSYPKIESMTVLVQKEVGQRMCTKAPSSAFSHFSLFVQTFSTPTYVCDVSPRSFFPRPKVSGAIVHLKLHAFPFPFEPEGFFAITKIAFGKKRKMLRSSLGKVFEKESIEQALISIGKKKEARPSELSPKAFARLYQLLSEEKDQ